MKDFEIVFEHALKIGSQIVDDPATDDFERQINIFNNFINQINQIISKKDHISDENFARLKQILDINIKIEQILVAKRDMVKDEIVRNNKKEQVKKRYNQSTSLGFNKKS